MSGTDPETDAIGMRENAFVLLGFSSFLGPKVNILGAVSQAEDIHAAAVIVYSKYKDTMSGIQEVITPTRQTSYTNANLSAFNSRGGSVNAYGTQTSFVPYSFDRNEFFASYWIKVDASKMVFGCIVKDLTQEQRRSIASNKGLLVDVVIRGTPAFDADLMRGDIIRKIAGEEVSTVGMYQDVLKRHAGESVLIEYIRDGKSSQRKIELRAPAA